MANKFEGSFLALNKKYLRLGLKSIDLMIIAQIEEFQRNGCACYITNEQLSEQFGESESTIKRSIDKLEKMNIVKRNTSFVKGQGRSNKQRTLSINPFNQWKVQNEPTKSTECKVQKSEMEGSNVDDGRFKNDEWKVHNEPIKENLKENIKDNSSKRKETEKREIEDLSDWEGNDICNRLKRNESYIALADKFNLPRGSITKEFPKKWNEIKKTRAYIAEQEAEMKRRSSEPQIDYERLYNASKQNLNKRHEETDIVDLMDEFFGEMEV